MQKQALFESILPGSSTLITESENGFTYLRGLFIQGEVQNHNGRVYPKAEIERAVHNMNSRLEELRSKTNHLACIAGELDHPEGLNINFDRVSHGITKMWMEGNNGHGSMRIMNEGLGKVALGALQIGIPVGVSSRGTGNVDSRGIVSEYDIVTIDLVINPSAPDAYPKASLTESMMASKSGKEILRLSDICREDRAAQKFIKNEITAFLKELSNKI